MDDGLGYCKGARSEKMALLEKRQTKHHGNQGQEQL